MACTEPIRQDLEGLYSRLCSRIRIIDSFVSVDWSPARCHIWNLDAHVLGGDTAIEDC